MAERAARIQLRLPEATTPVMQARNLTGNVDRRPGVEDHRLVKAILDADLAAFEAQGPQLAM